VVFEQISNNESQTPEAKAKHKASISQKKDQASKKEYLVFCNLLNCYLFVLS